jgi:hypothetical protein
VCQPWIDFDGGQACHALAQQVSCEPGAGGQFPADNRPD